MWQKKIINEIDSKVFVYILHLLVKPLRQAGLDSMEIVKLLFSSLQTELAAPVYVCTSCGSGI